MKNRLREDLRLFFLLRQSQSVPISGVKGQSFLKPISVKSSRGKVQWVLLGVEGEGEGMKGRILYLHLCGIRGQSSEMKGHSMSEVTRYRYHPDC